MAGGAIKPSERVKSIPSEYATPVFEPASPQFRLRSISKHLQEKINIYKTDKSPFNRADLNYVAAHAKSLIEEAKIKGAEPSTFVAVQNMINQATHDLRSADIAFGKVTQAPQIPYIPQVKLDAPLITKSGNGIGDVLATIPNGISIAGTAFVGGGFNAVTGIPNAASGVINSIIKVPAKVNDFFSLVQPATGETSAKSWVNSPFRHFAYNARQEVAQTRKINKLREEAFNAEQKKKGVVPAYSEAIFGFLGSFAVDAYIGGKVFKNLTKSKVKPNTAIEAGTDLHPRVPSGPTRNPKVPTPKRDVKLQGHLGELNLRLTALPEEITARYNLLVKQLSSPVNRNYLDKITKAERLKRVNKAYEYIKIQKGM